jgi:hypothetical protein
LFIRALDHIVGANNMIGKCEKKAMALCVKALPFSPTFKTNDGAFVAKPASYFAPAIF